MNEVTSYQNIISDIRKLVSDGRLSAYRSVSNTMIHMYWSIGKRIVEQEQAGAERAEYGKRLIRVLSEELMGDFGSVFSERNLRSYRQFYRLFPDCEIWNECVPNLNWTHFRSLLRVSDEDARDE